MVPSDPESKLAHANIAQSGVVTSAEQLNAWFEQVVQNQTVALPATHKWAYEVEGG